MGYTHYDETIKFRLTRELRQALEEVATEKGYRWTSDAARAAVLEYVEKNGRSVTACTA
jgi:metal-responsive CopG/Arc/MetJ family transcriptional regulator